MIFYGAGGHAKVVIDSWLRTGKNFTAIYDDDPKVRSLAGWPVSGMYQAALHPNEPIVISIGDNEKRRKIAERISGRTFGIVLHPDAILADTSSIGKGSMIMAGVIVNHSAKTGMHCILNTGCIVEHDCILDNYVHAAPNATLCGGVSVGEGALIGAGSVILPGITIGKWSIVGAGAVVIADLPDHAVAVGNPARVIVRAK